MAKLVDAPDLGSGVAIRVGSSPIRRTETKEASLSSFFVLSILGFVWGDLGLCSLFFVLVVAICLRKLWAERVV